MSCFMCDRMAEASKSATDRAEKAEAETVQQIEVVLALKKKFKEARRQLIRDAMRALHCPPFLVIPHMAPSPRGPAAARVVDRFSLVEIE